MATKPNLLMHDVLMDKRSGDDLSSRLSLLHAVWPECGFVSTQPAARWDFGTVVGNGVQGALAFCRPYQEELVLSHEELFLPLFPWHGYLPVKEHYETIRNLVLEGRAGEAQELLKRIKEKGHFPLYNTTDPFVGAGSLDVLMPLRTCDSYLRSVDFTTGEALVAWQDECGVFHRRFFVSRAADVMVLKISSPSGRRFDLQVGLREIAYVPEAHPKAQDIYGKTMDRCESDATETRLIHRMHLKKHWDDQKILGSATVARVIVKGGRTSVDKARLHIHDANEVLLLIRTVPDRKGDVLDVEQIALALSEIEPDYATLLRDNASVHGEIFGRCHLRLSDPSEQNQSSEDLQAQSCVGKTSRALTEKAFSAGRYGIISSTGRMPPLLQGVWTGTWKPRWSGDYTLNGNVQSMVAASLCGNHYECQEVLMDYLDSLMDDFRENARELLGFRGPLIPWRSSTHGRTHYLSCFGYYHDFPGIYWFAGAGWFARIYYEYYLHTGDETFFETRLKPFFLDAAALYEDYLTLERDGVYVLAPSSSPENETAKNIWMAPNATMTIAVIRQLLRTVIRLEAKLGVTKDRGEKWRGMLAKMPVYQIGANGALKEWSWPGIENNEEHRHASHLYPLYFGIDPEIEESAELREACRVAIDRRMEFRRHEDGSDMAFGFVQLGLSAAHLGDTALAYECVEYLVNSYWSPAMVSLHNVKNVFNLDISGGLPALMIAMLVQSDGYEAPWRIRLLPCLPQQWPEGEIRGVRCRGGFEVDLSWRRGALETVKIKSVRGESLRLESGESSTHLHLVPGEHRVLSGNLKEVG